MAKKDIDYGFRQIEKNCNTGDPEMLVKLPTAKSLAETMAALTDAQNKVVGLIGNDLVGAGAFTSEHLEQLQSVHTSLLDGIKYLKVVEALVLIYTEKLYSGNGEYGVGDMLAAYQDSIGKG